MKDFLNRYKPEIGDGRETPFLNRLGIYQDGTTPMYRDGDGTLWAMSGHSHMGHIGMFAGSCLDDLKELYPIQTNFCVGHADYAFSGIRYPEGVKARGSIWPFGLYICPVTHRFFCFFHNESGWNGKGTAYDALGPCETPHFDSDFRHIGLMHSDDEGKNWTFDRWVLTAEHACFTEKYNPGAGTALGQPAGKIGLGGGDFSLYADPAEEYLYLFYNIAGVDMDKGRWTGCDVYVARTRRRSDGLMGDFVKYYDGAFCEPGNMGRETAIVKDAWHPRVLKLKDYGCYLMTSCPVRAGAEMSGLIENVMQVRSGEDLLHWSEPVRAERDGKEFGNHYVALVSDDGKSQPCEGSGNRFVALTNHNGTDVTRWDVTWVEREMTDILVFGGQSNMQGQTEGLSADSPVPNAWEYRHGTHSLVPLRHPVGEEIGGGLLSGAHLGRGSLIPACCRTYAALTGRKVVAVHAAKGATKLSEWMKGTPRYAAAVDKILGAERAVRESDEVGKIFYIWLQGESDALAKTPGDEYFRLLVRYGRDLKEDCGTDMFGIIRVGYFSGTHVCDEEIMRAQDRAARTEGFCMLTDICPALSLDPAFLNPEAPGHYNNAGMERIGEAAGRALARLVGEN